MTSGGEFWDREVAQPTHNHWMLHLPVRIYMNESISGRAGGWPLDWFQETFPGIHFKRSLSIGCGTGPLERDLIRRNICDSIDAFDGSLHSLHIARREAEKEGIADRIRYFAADFNAPDFPERHYDAVFFHQSLHHVGKLEKLFRAVMHTLKPDGLLYLDEMIGPSRSYWTLETFAPWRRIWESLPPEYREEAIHLPIVYDDPSEAARSSEIMSQLAVGFDVTHFRGYGGNILAILVPLLRDPPESLLHELIEMEKKELARGKTPFYAVIVAKPKNGWQATLAAARYFIEPKLKRIGRELTGRR